MLAAAAETEPDGGRLPQLAAITGKIAELETSLATELTALRASVSDDVARVSRPSPRRAKRRRAPQKPPTMVSPASEGRRAA